MQSGHSADRRSSSMTSSRCTGQACHERRPPPVSVCTGWWSTMCCDAPAWSSGIGASCPRWVSGRTATSTAARLPPRSQRPIAASPEAVLRALAIAGIERRPAQGADAAAQRRRRRGVLRRRAAVAGGDGEAAGGVGPTSARRRRPVGGAADRVRPVNRRPEAVRSALHRRRHRRGAGRRVRPHPAPGGCHGPLLRAAATAAGHASCAADQRPSTGGVDRRWPQRRRHRLPLRAWRCGLSSGVAARAVCCDRRRTRCVHHSAGRSWSASSPLRTRADIATAHNVGLSTVTRWCAHYGLDVVGPRRPSGGGHGDRARPKRAAPPVRRRTVVGAADRRSLSASTPPSSRSPCTHTASPCAAAGTGSQADAVVLLDALYADPAVVAVLEHHRVPLRRRAGRLARRFPRPAPLDAGLVDELYRDVGLTTTHISLLTGHSASNVCEVLRRHGIPTRPSSRSPWYQRTYL